MATPLNKEEFIRLFPGKAPFSENVTMEEVYFEEVQADGRIKKIMQNIVTPGLYPYIPEGEIKGAVIIVPGGAFKRLVINYEGSEIASWFKDNGYAAFVLTPRLPLCLKDKRITYAPHEHVLDISLVDMQRAVRIVKSLGKKYGYEGKKVGVCGFSAGGNLSTAAATCFDRKVYPRKDEIDDISARPDFCIAGYPAVSKSAQVMATKKKKNYKVIWCLIELARLTRLTTYTKSNIINQLSEVDCLTSTLRRYSTDKLVKRNTPPLFIFETDTDTTTFAENSVKLYLAARRKGVSGELHIFRTGGHSFGKGDHLPQVGAWKKLCLNWLETL